MNELDIIRIVAYALDHPWAITPHYLSVVASILGRRAAGRFLSHEELAAALPPKRPQASGAKDVAIIPVHGVIAPRANMLSDISGGASFETLGAQTRAAMSDPTIGTIVFDVDSPGGNAAGATEFAKVVRAAAATKRTIAHANHLMASAAYWAMSGATEIIASPSAEVGSIGVLTIHEDLSKALAEEGVSPTLITAGKFKGEGNPYGPLNDDAAAFLQKRVNDIYATFTKDVAKGRSVPVGTVRSDFGEGRAISAQDALAAGMIDRVEDFTDTLSGLTTSKSRSGVAARTDTTEADDQEQSQVLASQGPLDVRFANDIEHRLLALRLRDLTL